MPCPPYNVVVPPYDLVVSSLRPCHSSLVVPAYDLVVPPYEAEKISHDCDKNLARNGQESRTILPVRDFVRDMARLKLRDRRDCDVRELLPDTILPIAVHANVVAIRSS